MKKIIFILSLGIIFLSSCSKQFNGSGIIVTEDRNLPSFHSIESTSSIDVFVTYGATQSVILEADDNLIDRITTRVNNNTLKIDVLPGSYSSNSLAVFLTIPVLKEISNDGSSDIEISDFEELNNLKFDNDGSGKIIMNDYIEIDHFIIDNDGSGNIYIKGFINELDISNDGSGKIEAKGEVNDFDITNKGSGRIKAYQLEANNCNLLNTGSGSAYIKCSENLIIKNTGSANVYYKGYPSISIQNTGSGKVRDAN